MKLCRPRRHHRGRCLSLADPAPLRRPGRGRAAAARGCCSCSRTAASTDAQRFQGKDAILSGPAGGIVGVVRTARQARASSKIIGFDMGGTSTDVSHFAGEFERALRDRGRRRAPARADDGIHTVAAGGGSILHFDGARFRVGPDSAGADPGPACYRRGGPLTVTDCNVMLGKLQPAFFPQVFGPGGDEPLDAGDRAREIRRARRRRSRRHRRSRAPRRSPRASSRIAVENMANAIKQISVAARLRRHRNTRCAASAAPAASMPAWSPTRSA